MNTKYWLIKSEPGAYSIDDLKKDKVAEWDGVRNYQARNNLRAMNVGDLCLFYHSVHDKQIVGMAEVGKSAYPDPTSDDKDKDGNPRWWCPDIKFY